MVKLWLCDRNKERKKKETANEWNEKDHCAMCSAVETRMSSNGTCNEQIQTCQEFILLCMSSNQREPVFSTLSTNFLSETLCTQPGSGHITYYRNNIQWHCSSSGLSLRRLKYHCKGCYFFMLTHLTACWLFHSYFSLRKPERAAEKV